MNTLIGLVTIHLVAISLSAFFAGVEAATEQWVLAVLHLLLLAWCVVCFFRWDCPCRAWRKA